MMEQGHALVRLGRAEDGVRLIDETMVAAADQAFAERPLGLPATPMLNA
jgi:hypothetical protein